MARIGILGGNFNPPHYGHLLAAKQAREKLRLGAVWLMPCFKHSVKRSGFQASTAQRLEMTRLACQGVRGVKASDFEIRLGEKSGKPTYTRETLLELKRAYPNHEFFWIIGADLVKQIPRWRNAEGLTRLAKFVVIPRPGFKAKRVSGFIFLKNCVESRASSKEIRARLRRGASVAGLVPEKVALYIKRKGLYI